MERLTQEFDIALRWRAFELRPPGSPPMPESYRTYIEAARPRLVQMARQEYDLQLKPGIFETSSRDALVGAKYAESQGMGPIYHTTVFRAFWQQEGNIGDRDHLASLVSPLGMDRNTFIKALDEPDYTQQVADDVNHARQLGITSIPAAVFNGKYLLVGAQPYHLLTELVQRIESEET